MLCTVYRTLVNKFGKLLQSFRVIQFEKTRSVLFFFNGIELVKIFGTEKLLQSFHVIPLEKEALYYFFFNCIEPWQRILCTVYRTLVKKFGKLVQKTYCYRAFM